MRDEPKHKILRVVEEKKIRFVNVQFTDIFGMLKSFVIPFQEFKNALREGIWFDGSSIEGFTEIHESDLYLKLDPETFNLLPWVSKENPTARILAGVYNPNGKPFKGCSRYILKRILKKAEESGFIYNTGPELEFFVFQKDSEKTIPEPHDNAGYFDYAPKDKAVALRKEIIYALENFGIHVEMSHHEVAKGQHEINFRYDNALKTADNIQTFKYTVKAIAHKKGLYATFMPKPIAGINGSGMHVHQSLFDLKGRNLFFDKKSKTNLSKIALNFIAGQLAHIKEISAVLNPTVNSYKRLISGYEAPVYICWGQRNRSALIRVPGCALGKGRVTRLELRCPDPSTNPYLAFALMLSAGLDGIEKELEPPEQTPMDVYKLSEEELKKSGIKTLPETLGEAIKEFKKSKLVKKTLGTHIFNSILKAKEREWKEYKAYVTRWEISNYLENF